MNPELTKLIEQYLSGELSTNDMKAFEDRLSSSETLRDAVAKQRIVHAGAKRANDRDKIEHIGKRYHLRKNLIRGGIGLLIAVIVAVGSWFVYDQFIANQIPQITEEVKAKLDELAPIDLESQYFVIPEDGGVVLSKQGVLISVPKDAFLKDGSAYNEPIALQFQEALSGNDILKSGLSTTSNGQLLETGGMVSVTGFTMDGEPLDFNPKVGVYVQVPTKDSCSDMQLFDGERKADGSINWIKPEPLEKIPVPVSMSKLDFYPAGYEPHLDEIKWKQSKASRDSLYLSFEEGFESEASNPNGEKLFYELSLDDLSIEDFDKMAQADSMAAASATMPVSSNEFILPSKVLAFWKPEFNKTNLSTREFEQRMQTIHETCDNAVLDVYTNNLNKSIKYCDDRVVSMGYPQFSKYAAENVGKLKAGNPHIKHLQKFYEKSVKQLKKRNQILQNQEQGRRNQHDSETKNSRNKESNRFVNREAQAYNEEFNYNLDNVYAQLGRTRGFTITSASAGISSSAARSAVKNIDRLVAMATTDRTSTTITDPETGKTAQLTYNDFTFEVNNADQYIKLFAYVMPYELNSYQRISGKNGKFDHPLNGDIRYNVAVVGVKKDGFGFFKKLNINAGSLGKIDLKTVSETKLNADVEQMNRTRNSSAMPISEELVWLRQEQKDYNEQKVRIDMEAFRQEIKEIIFPCFCPPRILKQNYQDSAEGEGW